MELWAVTNVKDELDILPYTLEHLVSEGVDGIIVADNNSTDGTWEYLNDVQVTLGCRIELLVDPVVGYYQSEKMTALAHAAFDHGADWVIPFDADELWHDTTDARTLHQTLDLVDPSIPCIRARLHNYFPMSTDPDTPNPYLRITYRDPQPSALPKVIVGRWPGVVIRQGNHDADGDAPYQKANSTIGVAHFPWRTAQQFETKVRNGYRAYQATDLPPDVGAHWRQYGQILLNEGPEALAEIFYTWFHDPDEVVEQVPAPWSRAKP